LDFGFALSFIRVFRIEIIEFLRREEVLDLALPFLPLAGKLL